MKIRLSRAKRSYLSLQVGCYYVFPWFIVFRTKKGIFAVSHHDLCGPEAGSGYRSYRNPIDGFKAYNQAFRLKLKYRFFVDLKTDDVRVIERMLTDKGGA